MNIIFAKAGTRTERVPVYYLSQAKGDYD